jgi:hypothetical protein
MLSKDSDNESGGERDSNPDNVVLGKDEVT